MTITTEAMALYGKDRPFYSGEEPSGWCDFLLTSGDACDDEPTYAVWWLPVPEHDRDTQPVSVTCLTHVAAVDRALVLHMTNDFGWRPATPGGSDGRTSDG